ncbi:MAG TPA: hypothetical protein VF787_08620 [Thermoanaerobaculia bacterium]
MFGEEVIAGFGEAVARGRAAGASANRITIDGGVDPPFALQLQKLLANGFAGQSEIGGELRDGRGSVPFQCGDDRAATVGEVVECENAGSLRVG